MQVKQKILCADDNRMVTEALRIHLASESDFEFVGSAASANEMLELIFKPPPQGTGCPDLVLLDIDMPGMNPFDAVRELANKCTKSRVLMYTGHVRRELIDQAIESGAWGYVSKNDGPYGLLNALRAVMKGDLGLSPEAMSVYAS